MAMKSVTLELYIYQGTETSFSDADLKYTISKSRISTQANITLEIGELVRDYLDLEFNNDYLSFTTWVKAVVTFFKEDGELYSYSNPQTFTYLATEGYGYFEDGTNPELSRNSLISASNIYLPDDTAGKTPIFAEGVGKVIIDSTTTQITDNGNTNQKIQYLIIPANSSTVKIYDTDDSTLLKTINITNICEPKFTKYKVSFVNKYGCFEDLWFFKKSTENLSVTDESFKRNTIKNSTSTYESYRSQNERYNVNGLTNLTLNTGFIVEDMNQTIEELFLSEQVWIRYENKTLPIVPKTKSMAFKTSVNDNLTSYTVDFEFAFNKINNVR
jgi:hypothetical protein